jgi:hypothetical protein
MSARTPLPYAKWDVLACAYFVRCARCATCTYATNVGDAEQRYREHYMTAHPANEADQRSKDD